MPKGILAINIHHAMGHRSKGRSKRKKWVYILFSPPFLLLGH